MGTIGPSSADAPSLDVATNGAGAQPSGASAKSTGTAATRARERDSGR